MLHRVVDGVRRRMQTVSPDQGDTLIEIILTIAVIAVTAVALVGAVLTAITGSSEHRSLSVDNAQLNSYVQSIQDTVERQGDQSIFTGCASASDLPQPEANGIDTSSSTWTIGITSIKYWAQGGSGFTSCTGGGTSMSLLLITATATSPTQQSSSITFAVRNPQATS
jgi:type II secretory pathway pseudopilin PulG